MGGPIKRNMKRNFPRGIFDDSEFEVIKQKKKKKNSPLLSLSQFSLSITFKKPIAEARSARLAWLFLLNCVVGVVGVDVVCSAYLLPTYCLPPALLYSVHVMLSCFLFYLLCACWLNPLGCEASLHLPLWTTCPLKVAKVFSGPSIHWQFQTPLTTLTKQVILLDLEG